ncbi:hypothetical protein [Chthonobacter albigriseus]|uniref:hypothetical protein n=1 Tax=Chthonobacter albigriseus TaxID=1683161 RepID=UPI0015EFB812|nr:hypothetical protein [Chthonobacter albigriseus]
MFDLHDAAKLMVRTGRFFITLRTAYELDIAIGCPVRFVEGPGALQGPWDALLPRR